MASDESLRIELPDGKGGVTTEDVPMRSAMNEVTRAAYVKDCDVGVQRWNRLAAEAQYDFRFRLPSTRFRVTEPGKVAGWIAPPEIGINNTPLDYEYVRLN